MENEQIWLGIDPGLATVGWAILTCQDSDSATIIDYGTIETPKKHSTARRLLELEKDLVALIDEFTPNYAALEMPFFSRQIKAAGGVLQAVGIINLVCYRQAQLEPIQLHQSSWKAHLGNGRATKDEVAQMLQQLLNLETIPIDDAVDAIGIAYAGLCGLTNNIN
ncbi:MAG: crossover junction endodeoxyribonuclease RuvC [Spirulinaceae cyanobacterium]